ncbi:unnamed protein product [Toxocara canis]|uniref:Uncharacterized protein n=1 Tax=Toxocara canis TaxID=6265 RepID=A0A183ULW4_TOXCA|nr:unnamed protein product [Toxocara canis]
MDALERHAMSSTDKCVVGSQLESILTRRLKEKDNILLEHRGARTVDDDKTFALGIIADLQALSERTRAVGGYRSRTGFTPRGLRCGGDEESVFIRGALSSILYRAYRC